MSDFFANFENAFKALEETLTWQQDQAPHMRGRFSATVLRGESQSGSAGPTRDAFPADAYSIIVDWRTAILNHVKVGDTICRDDGTQLTVQQITFEHGIGATIRATAIERASL